MVSTPNTPAGSLGPSSSKPQTEAQGGIIPPESQQQGELRKDNEQTRTDLKNRDLLAGIIVFLTIGAIFVISATTIIASKEEERKDSALFVMNATLPLYGTWVGTILAFYFSSNAFAAASIATDRNADRNVAVLKQLNAATIGTAPPDDRLKQILVKSLDNGLIFSRKKNDETPLKDVVKDLKDKNRYRIIIVDQNNVFSNILFLKNAEDYLKANPARADIKLKEYLDEIKAIKVIVSYIAEKATLFDAQEAMQKEPGCTDVIATTDGAESSPVTVYITDFDLTSNK